MKEVTQKQLKVIEVIKKLENKNHKKPTLKEIMLFMGYKNTSSVQRITDALKKKGVLLENKFQHRNFYIDKSIEDIKKENFLEEYKELCKKYGYNINNKLTIIK